jgi:uncharacterized integral membrane protein
VIIALIIVVLVVTFALLNLSESDVRFLGWRWDVPTTFLFLITFIAGLITGRILAALGMRRQGREEKKTEEAKSAGS